MTTASASVPFFARVLHVLRWRPPVPKVHPLLDIAELNRRSHVLDVAAHHTDRWLAQHGTRRDRLARETFADLFDL